MRKIWGICAVIILGLAVHFAYADQTIDQLGSATALSGTERIPVFQGTNPAKSTTASAIADYVIAVLGLGSTVTVGCGTGGNVINTAIAANPPGTTFNLPASCTYSGEFFHTKNYITIRGAGAGSTILDGGGTTNWATNGMLPAQTGGDGTVGVTIQGVTIRNYGTPVATPAHDDSCNIPQPGMIWAWNGWVLQNNTFSGAGCVAVRMAGSATARYNTVTTSKHGGIITSTDYTGTAGNPQVYGNEVFDINKGGYDPQFATGDGAVAAIKTYCGTNAVTQQTVKNNYVHDNIGAAGIWFDINCYNATVQGNTVINNGAPGIWYEISCAGDISGNVVKAHVTNSKGPAIYISGASGTGKPAGGVPCQPSGVLNVHHNYIQVPATVTVNTIYDGALTIECSSRPDSMCGGNTNLYNNTVVFLGGNQRGVYGAGNFTCGSICAATGTTTSNFNTFYVPSSTSDTHFYWLNAGGTFQTFATGLQGQGQDASSTIQAGSGPTVPGCTQVGCTGSGWP